MGDPVILPRRPSPSRLGFSCYCPRMALLHRPSPHVRDVFPRCILQSARCVSPLFTVPAVSPEIRCSCLTVSAFCPSRSFCFNLRFLALALRLAVAVNAFDRRKSRHCKRLAHRRSLDIEFAAKRMQRSRLIAATSLRTCATTHAHYRQMRAHWKGFGVF